MLSSLFRNKLLLWKLSHRHCPPFVKGREKHKSIVRSVVGNWVRVPRLSDLIREGTRFSRCTFGQSCILVVEPSLLCSYDLARTTRARFDYEELSFFGLVTFFVSLGSFFINQIFCKWIVFKGIKKAILVEEKKHCFLKSIFANILNNYLAHSSKF